MSGRISNGFVEIAVFLFGFDRLFLRLIQVVSGATYADPQ
jgi:hypothetical protein